ncbi:hypothetical protein FRC11_008227 [Ceratobasidium sp. 423]|nr:hypothetical protein FRC11_008227 [Ceratobasidium sp. 423]
MLSQHVQVNVLISSNGTPMLNDFGSASVQNASVQFTNPTSGGKHTTRWAVGSPIQESERQIIYSTAQAPEILLGTTGPTREADVYALGMTILEILTGNVPYAQLKTDIAVMNHVVWKKELPPRPMDALPSTSVAGDDIWDSLIACWSSEPAKRPSANVVQGTMASIEPNMLLPVVGNSRRRMQRGDFGVPEDRFLCLYDERATREAIFHGFVNHLLCNPSIRQHDPIVIYFTGYGDCMPAPHDWQSADGMVGAILPHDAGTSDKHKLDNNEIPNWALAFLLHKLSQEKGNNITVILDSSYSGGGTKGEIRSRDSHNTSAPILDSLDSLLRKSIHHPSEMRQTITSKKFSRNMTTPSLDTHILLAACRSDEQAKVHENPNVDPDLGQTEDLVSSGIFTTALLKELRNCDFATMSYTTLIRKLLDPRRHDHSKEDQDSETQTFQCEGRNQDRLLFSVQSSVSKGKIALIPTQDKATYRVRVGSAQGIVPGTEFEVFSSTMDPTSPPVAKLVAREVGPIISWLHVPEPNASPEILEDAYATILRYNNHSNGVRIWVDEQVKQNETWKGIRTSLDSLPISWATSPENHDVMLLPAKGDIELRAVHLVPGRLETSRIIEHGMGAKQLAEILTSIVYLHFHLKVQNKDAPIRTQLGMALRELNEKDNFWGSITYQPKGNNLFGDSVSLGTVPALHSDPDKVFGLELTNNSTKDLFPYVLYYNLESYSVECLYEPPGRPVKAPLQAGKSLTIGYGSGDSQPFQVKFINPKSNREPGAFVVLVFGEWVDIAYLHQVSPFGAVMHRKPEDATLAGDDVTSPQQGPNDNPVYRPSSTRDRRGLNKTIVWDSIIVPIETIREQ